MPPQFFFLSFRCLCVTVPSTVTWANPLATWRPAQPWTVSTCLWCPITILYFYHFWVRCTCPVSLCAVFSPSAPNFCQLPFAIFWLLQMTWSKCTSSSQPSNGGSPLRTTWRPCLPITMGSVDFFISVFDLFWITCKSWSYFSVLHTVFEESSENHGSTQPAGWQHGVRPELQRGLIFEEAQPTGLLLNWSHQIYYSYMFKRKALSESVSICENRSKSCLDF